MSSNPHGTERRCSVRATAAHRSSKLGANRADDSAGTVENRICQPGIGLLSRQSENPDFLDQAGSSTAVADVNRMPGGRTKYENVVCTLPL